MFAFAIGQLIQFAIGTLILAGFLWMFWGGNKDGIFGRMGIGPTWARCAALVGGMQVVAWLCLVLIGMSQSLFVALVTFVMFVAAWLFGLKTLFGKTWGEAAVATVVMFVTFAALQSAANALLN